MSIDCILLLLKPVTISKLNNFSEKGFISLTPTNNRTIHVRSGESLSLNVDMEAYPKPHISSWSFMGHELRNTTDHVITTHSHEYRCNNNTQIHICFKCDLPQSYHIDENVH